MKKKKTDKRNVKLPDPALLELPPRAYQPSRAELKEEIDMPGLSLKKARKLFMRPFRTTL